MVETKINNISQEEIDRIRKIYDDRWELEEQWRLEKALEEREKEGLQKGLQQGMKQGIQQGLQKGKKEGIEEGLKSGINQEKKNVILKLLKKYSEEEVSEMLEVDLNEIKNIIE